MNRLRWKVGDRVEAKDFMNVWYPSKVVACDENEDVILVHFEGWNQRFDEWFPSNSDKIRPLHNKSCKESLKISSTQFLKVGQYVSAPWKDGESYPGRIRSINHKQRKYEVSFLDGATRHVSFRKVRVMTHEEIQELNYNLGTSDIVSVSTDSRCIQDGEMLGRSDKKPSNFDGNHPIEDSKERAVKTPHSSVESCAPAEVLDDKMESCSSLDFCLICGKDVSQNKILQNVKEPQSLQSGDFPCLGNEHLPAPKWLHFMNSLNSLQKMLKNNEQIVKLVKSKLIDEGHVDKIYSNCKIIKSDQRFIEDALNKIEELVDDLSETSEESDR